MSHSNAGTIAMSNNIIIPAGAPQLTAIMNVAIANPIDIQLLSIIFLSNSDGIAARDWTFRGHFNHRKATVLSGHSKTPVFMCL